MAQLKDTTINGDLHLKGEGVKIYINDTEFQGGGGIAPEFIDSVSMGRVEGSISGKNSVALGSNVTALTEGSTAFGVNTIAGGLGYFILGIEPISDTETLLQLSKKQVSTNPPVDKRYYEGTYEQDKIISDVNINVNTGDDIYIICPDNHYLFAGKVSYANEDSLVVTEFNLWDDDKNTNNKIFSFNDLVAHWQEKNVLPTNWSGTFADFKQGIEGINEGEPLVGPRDYSVVICQQPAWGVIEVTQAGYAIGSGTTAVGDYSYAEGRDGSTGGPYSHVEGRDNRAGYGAHAEGKSNFSRGRYSHTEGQNNIARGHSSHAEGHTNEVIGKYSHAEGRKNTAYGEASHIEGEGTNLLSKFGLTGAEENNVLIEKWNKSKFSLAKGKESHSAGEDNLALGLRSRAVGYQNIVTSHCGIADGQLSTVTGNTAKASGRNQNVSGDYATAEGGYNIATGAFAHVEGASIAKGSTSSLRGSYSVTYRDASYTEGSDITISIKENLAEGQASHVEGVQNAALSYGAHVEGIKNLVVAEAAHAEGTENVSSGNYSHTEGRGNVAGTHTCHAEGYKTKAIGSNSHSEGQETVANAARAHAEGHGTIASGASQHVQGKWNVANASFAHIIGNGSKEDDLNPDGSIKKQNRSNAHTVDWDGNAWYAGGMTIEGDLTVNGNINGNSGGGSSESIDWSNINEDYISMTSTSDVYINTDHFQVLRSAGDPLIDASENHVKLANAMTVDMYGDATVYNGLIIGNYRIYEDDNGSLVFEYQN